MCTFKSLKYLIPLTVFLLILIACSKFEPKAPADNTLLDGPVEGLTTAQTVQFVAGDIAFNDEIFTASKGLGPIFVATSCGGCHAGDGKGTPFTTLTRFGQSDSTGNQFLHQGGPQWQQRALPGFAPEVIPLGAPFSKFTPPANSGLGFIELVSDADILAISDPYDIDGDGISGVPNWNVIPHYVTIAPHSLPQGDKYIGRFGKKGATYDLLHQTVNAYNQDLGITSSFNPIDVYTGKSIDPEVSDKTIRDVVAYLQMLKAPIPRNQDHEKVQMGKQIFMQSHCGKCHMPQLKTGDSPIASLRFKTFFPYTDLLLHDMGPALDDGYTEGSAKTYEWRTPALWGLGLSPASQGGKYFLMHDGRANSIAEAIEMHGGEALPSKQQYQQLSPLEKEALIQFLESL